MRERGEPEQTDEERGKLVANNRGGTNAQCYQLIFARGAMYKT